MLGLNKITYANIKQHLGLSDRQMLVVLRQGKSLVIHLDGDRQYNIQLKCSRMGVLISKIEKTVI